MCDTVFAERDPKNRTLEKFLGFALSAGDSEGRVGLSPQTAERILGHLGKTVLSENAINALNDVASKERADDFVAPAVRLVDDFTIGEVIRFRIPSPGNGFWVDTGDYIIDHERQELIIWPDEAGSVVLDPRYPALFPLAQIQSIRKSPGGAGIRGTPISMARAQNELSSFVAGPPNIRRAATLVDPVRRHLHMVSSRNRLRSVR